MNIFLECEIILNSNDPILVTGGAGFIGSHFVSTLLKSGKTVHVVDNLSAGNIRNIKKWKDNKKFKFYKIDLTNKKLVNRLQKYKIIYHCAADPEVRTSVSNPETHFKNNVISTLNLLGKMRGTLEKFIFLSTSTVYGDATKIPTLETYSPLVPISPYGASKLACEALICSYSYSYNFKSIVFRLANIIGEGSNHGIIFDFIKKLNKNPKKLEILGDGTQNKSYLHISDCIKAIQLASIKPKKNFDIFNVGSNDQIDVKHIAKAVTQNMKLKNVEFILTGGMDGGRGWKGDVKLMKLNISKIKKLGWKNKYNSLNSIEKSIHETLK